MQDDVAFWTSLVLYLNNVGAGADGLHNPITSFYMWAWDANADDTFGSGGLVASDWESLNWQKLGALIGNNSQFTYGLELTPWYLPGFTLPTGKICIQSIRPVLPADAFIRRVQNSMQKDDATGQVVHVYL